jgi:hypothetical protein
MVEWIQDGTHWEQLTAEWGQVLSRSAEDFPFLDDSLQQAWWRHRGGGEWPEESKLRILISRDSDRVRGIAPMFRASGEEEPAYRLIGDHEIMDCLSVLCAPADIPFFCEELCAAMQKLPVEEWRRWELANMFSSSPVIPALVAAAQKRGWPVERISLEECPVIALPATWDEYLATLEKKQRHEIRRKLRRAEAAGPLELRIDMAGDLETEVESFLMLMETDPRKASFLTASMRAQFLALASAAHQKGMLELAFLVVEGQYAAAFFNFVYRNRTWVYNSGFHPKFAALSPGWVLLAKLIQRAIVRGQSAFDFMRGNEDYKFQWGGKPQQQERLIIRR